jgi:integrase
MLNERGIAARRQPHKLQAAERPAAGPLRNDEDLVFPNEIGGKWDPGYRAHFLRRYLERLELPRIRFHDLRHTCATFLLSAGTHPKVVSEMLGHSTIVLTLDTY